VRRSIIRVCLFLIVLASPCAVHSAGLGKFTLNSYLGEPFKAEIDLVSVKKEEIPSLVVRLASRDTFRQANVDYAPFLFTFEFSVENRADGQPYVKITSPQRIVKPFLNLLVDLNWSSGRLIREYTVLLDPPEDALQPMAPAIQVEPVVPSSVKSEPAPAEPPDSIIEEAVSDEEPAVQEAAPVQEVTPVLETAPVKKSDVITYGPVKSGDTLAKIALEVVPPHVQPNQMLISLLENVEDKIIRPMQENAIAREMELNEANERIALLENNQDKIIRPMQENAIAREKVLNEGNERIAMLENNVKDLKHLLELENTTLAVSPVVPPKVEQQPSVEGEESSLFTWQWLWWVVILLAIAGSGWKHWKVSKNGATKAKQRHPYFKFSDTYKTRRNKSKTAAPIF